MPKILLTEEEKRERTLASSRKWRKKNLEKARSATKEWVKKNPEFAKASSRKSSLKYIKNNRELVNFRASSRKYGERKKPEVLK